MTFQVEGLDELRADLRDAPQRVQKRAAASVAKGAHNIKQTAQQLAPTGPYLPQYAASISYDLGFVFASGELSAEIGPDKDRPQGALGNIVEYGTSKTPPQAHLGPAFDLEQPKFVKALSDDVGDL